MQCVPMIEESPRLPGRIPCHVASTLGCRVIPAELTRRLSRWMKNKTFFVSSQRKPLHRSTVNLLFGKYSTAASLPLHARPHMLRHGCGFALADQGADTRLIQDYLGHRNIQHTVRYTAANLARLSGCGGEIRAQA